MSTSPKKKTQDDFIEPEIHRRVLDFLNTAHRIEDLKRLAQVNISAEVRQQILKERDSVGAFGFTSVKQLLAIKGLNEELIDKIIQLFGRFFYGQWTLLCYNTQRPDGTLFPTAHAAMLRTGRVLFLPSWEPADTVDTILWDPTDEVNPQFEYPVIQPTEFLFCSGHSFLMDGRLLCVGGGGNFISNAINSGWKFDPNSRRWEKTIGSMSHARWYPTAVTLGETGRVFIASGYGVSAVEAYDEATDSFLPVSGPAANPSAADRNFPETYPGLHLLPGGEIFYSRTGWHGPDDTGLNAAYFRFTDLGTLKGEWVELGTPDPMHHPDRTEGMSVILLDKCKGTRVFVVGGGLPDSGGRNNAEIINLSTLTPTWPHPLHMPEERFNVNAVLLPDGNVFVLGGRAVQNSPCRIFNPSTHTFSQMADLKYRREYHSIALLLPSGKVMTTGGDYGNTITQKTTIEIFSPPYLFRGPRPQINAVPDLVHHNHTFKLETAQAAEIEKVVLVRPMAVTHHTDSEQRVLEMEFTRNGNALKVIAPGGPDPHYIAPRGYYMLFILNAKGVPSEAKFIHLH